MAKLRRSHLLEMKVPAIILLKTKKGKSPETIRWRTFDRGSV